MVREGCLLRLLQVHTHTQTPGVVNTIISRARAATALFSGTENTLNIHLLKAVRPFIFFLSSSYL